jgi:isocitrate dehydrogenase
MPRRPPCASSTSRHDGTVTVLKDGPEGARRRDPRRHVHERRRALVLPRRADRPDAKAEGVLFSLHLKATMMKVSDPIMFGHAVRCSSPTCSPSTATVLAELGVDPNNGLGDLLAKPRVAAEAERAADRGDIAGAYAAGPALAMVDSDKGITNLHVPSDVIVDASMPAMIRDSGRCGTPRASSGHQGRDPRPLLRRHLPGRHRRLQGHGAFDPRTMGSVPNVGLMAQKAEEYGSHDKTFEIAAPAPCAWSTPGAPS